jgi:aerobic carbon-monoxide dehydrogenase medium subunit
VAAGRGFLLAEEHDDDSCRVRLPRTEAEAALQGKTPDEATIKRVAELAAEASEPAEDLRGSVAYKKDLVRVLTARALRKALERAGGRS